MSLFATRRSGSAGTLALTALTPLAWGSTYAVTTEFLPPDRPMFTAVMRALPAGLALLVIGRVLPRGVWIWRAACCWKAVPTGCSNCSTGRCSPPRRRTPTSR